MLTFSAIKASTTIALASEAVMASAFPVIASAAKQPRGFRRPLGCFVASLLAMTEKSALLAMTARGTSLIALPFMLAALAPAFAATPYLRSCDTFGSGFFVVPGSDDTCLRIDGYLRADVTLASTGAQAQPRFNSAAALPPLLASAATQDASAFTSRFALGVDLRSLTAFGTLRAYGLGDFDAGTGAATGLERGFIQFAGLTAGRAESFFDFYAYGVDMLDVRDSYAPTGMLAFTGALSNGFSASLGLEDPNTRALVPLALSGMGASAAPAGAHWPDLVANLRFDGEAVTLQASAALHQTRLLVSDATGLQQAASLGFAAQVGARFDLGVLTSGDSAWLQAAYADGALNYLGFGAQGLGGATLQGDGLLRPDTDVVVTADRAGVLTLERQRGFTALAAFSHFWRTDVRQSILLGYATLLPGTATRDAAWTVGGLGRWQEWRAGSELEWTPVAGLSIGVEGEVQRVRQGLAGAALAATPPLPPGARKDATALVGRLRVQRAF